MLSTACHPRATLSPECVQPSTLSLELLQKQDDRCSEAILAALKSNELFQKIATTEGECIVQRDAEDDEKLAKGIKLSIEKKILPAFCQTSPTRQINVRGLTAEEVAKEIIQYLPNHEGNIIILQGLSGTGKGTTVEKLKSLLPKCVTWSNGNVFRCYTLLAMEALKALNLTISTESLLRSPWILETAVKRVTFEKIAEEEYDIMIDGKQRVKEIENTFLKAPPISSAVPIVAELTQGEVICFGQEAVNALSRAGFNIILEGRAQTLQYIDTKNRFELMFPEISLVGERRGAQRVMARALELVQSVPEMSVEDAVMEAVTLLS